jgi:hypothetical protein
MRALAACVIALAGGVVAGCCMMGGNAPAPYAPPATPPVAPSSFTADCLGLCQRTGACMDARGAPRGADELDCAASCTPGGAYANMPPESLSCVSSPTCEAFDACNGAALAAMLARALGGGPSTPPPSGAAPEGWPAGFPVVPGGAPMQVPPAGPVRVAVLAYTGTTPDALDASYHAALAAGGWTAPPSESGPEAHRFTATSGATSVSVSIYGEGGQTMIQTMQMLF